MHYRNGREAKNGDIIVSLNNGKVNAFGVLHSATPGNDYCNGNIAVIQSTQAGACMCDCLHVDDLAAILAERLEHGVDEHGERNVRLVGVAGVVLDLDRAHPYVAVDLRRGESGAVRRVHRLDEIVDELLRFRQEQLVSRERARAEAQVRVSHLQDRKNRHAR